MQQITVKIKASDSKVLDTFVLQMVSDVTKTGAKISGPVPLPNRRKLFCLHRGPHIDASSKEHFQIITHTRLLIIKDINPKTVEILSVLQAPSGVDIQVK